MELIVKLAIALTSITVTVVFAIIGFFIVKYFKDQDTRDEKQTEAIATLNDTSKTLRAAVEVLKTKQTIYETYCDKNHSVVNHRLHSHDEKLNEHDKDISILKTKVG
ncbi:hypothetical protein [Sunxiuqinia indica]|uniref:hypothetical protein n=1 Tax=Sunxiuqinia indica TaxID=2692584 RepID=UPI00135C7D19|nr:hypothetical protein [Sunxiuqinia indica]